jgi:hypothetical protein
VRGEVDLAAAAPASRPARVDGGRWGWVAAAAAVLAFAVGYGLRPGGDAIDSAAAKVSTGLVEPVERGREGGSVVTVAPDSEAVILTVVVDLPRDAFPATVELLDADDAKVLEYRVASPAALEDEAYLSLTCGVKRCPPGPYTVRIAAGTAAEHRIPLRLISGATGQ